MRGGERGSQGTPEKKQRIGDGNLINDTISEPYGHEIDTREVERNNQREIMKAKLLKAYSEVLSNFADVSKIVKTGVAEERHVLQVG